MDDWYHPSEPIRAELIGSNCCTAKGITAYAEAPVLKLCRALIRAGTSPDTPMEVYRGKTLALTVRRIGEAAALEIDHNESGQPVFRPARKRPIP